MGWKNILNTISSFRFVRLRLILLYIAKRRQIVLLSCCIACSAHYETLEMTEVILTTVQSL